MRLLTSALSGLAFAIRWLFALPGNCIDCNTKNKIVHGPTFSIEFCPKCDKRA